MRIEGHSAQIAKRNGKNMAASALSTTLTTTSATTPAKMIQIASSSQTPRVILVDQAAVTMADDDSFIDGRNEIVDDEVDDDRHVDEEMRIESTKKQAKPTAATATPTTTQIPNRSIHCQNTSRTPTKNTSSTTTTSDGPISGHCPDHPNSPWRRPQSFSSSTSPSERLSPTRTPAATTATQSPAEESTTSPLSPIPLRLQPARTYDPAFEILRSVAPRSMEAITKSQSADPDYDRGSIYRSTPGEPISQHQIPRRNLSETFEELYAMKQTPKTRLNTAAASTSSSEDTLTTSATTIDTDLHHHHLPTIETSSSSSKISGVTDVASMISPTGVTELHHRSGSLPPIYSPSTSMVADDADEADMEAALKQRAAPEFKLHSSLQRLMSDDLVQRVSFYAVIHDINKEASAMAANDNSGYSATPDDADEVHDPIVMAVCGESSAVIENDEKKSDENMYANALIDEEQWLLNVIESRSTDETCDLGNAACPPTFLQAMGELEYENPVATLSGGARTQLWKPSRSWWEAKSGKNPWIEPKYHNKRWRYLWPLIHYHKFLAKCIKKLKRNGVDVKISPSPVSAFLREEVCAVSDHLADVSLFDSEQWMDCLQHFFGWTESTKAAEEKSRKLVSELKLRPIQEPGDIDSPLLRSQIDEQFLRAIIQARTLLNVGGPPSETTKRQAKEPTLRREPIHANTKQISSVSSTSHGRHTAAKSHKSRRGLQVAQVSAQQWHGYPPTGWWQPSWQPHAAYPFPDEQSSVHSALSSDSYSHGYMHSYHPNTAVGFHQHPYYPPMMYPQQQMMPGSQNGTYDGSIYQPMAYSSYPMGCGWTSQTEMNNLPHRSDELPAYPSTPSRHQDNYSADLGNAFETPYKHDPNQTNAASPYWNHLQDHATLAMMGLASPQGTLIAPSTPHQHNAVLGPSPESDAKVAATTAQPLFLRQQYYGYSYGGREGYVPPSPASQFQMTPQSGRTFNYTYGFSPRRPPSHSKTSSARISEENKNISDKSGPVTPEKH